MPYRERLTTPPWYWLVGIAFGVTSVVAMSLWLGNELALGAGLVAVALLTTLLLWWGRTEIVVEPGGEGDAPAMAAERTLPDGASAAAYLCEDHVCRAPVTTPDDLSALLAGPTPGGVTAFP